MTKELFALKRNDIEGALRIRALAKAAGTWSAADEVTIYRLQDDSGDKLEAAIKKAEPKLVIKALPRLSDDQREEKAKKVGAKTGKAATKTVGSGGQVRYGYLGEKGGDKKSAAGGPKQVAQPGEQDAGGGGQDTTELPHPHLPSPNPEASPIAAAHPDKPDPNDPRAPDPHHPQQPKHTLNLGEFMAATKLQRAALDKLVARMRGKFGEQARQKFQSFMTTHLAEFVEEHGLDGDYFGLMFDVLTGAVPEGQPAAATAAAQAGAKPPKQPNA